MNTVNTKAEFKTLNSELMSPFLKSLGFKKKADNYYRIVNDIIQHINLQKSSWNSDESIEFTFNIGFFNSEVHKITTNSDVIPITIKEFDCLVSFRLGGFVHGHDHWYMLSFSNGYNKVKEEITNDFIDYLKTLFGTYTTLKSLEPLIEKYSQHNVLQNIVYYFQTNDLEKGINLLKSSYTDALLPKSTTHTTVYPDGRTDVRESEPAINVYIVEALERIASHYEVSL